MRLTIIRKKPFTIINGKDFAVYKWHTADRQEPIFIQLAGKTALTREDLPTDDWIVKNGRDQGNRIATAWRRPWFDYRADARRKLAFLGASTEGSIYLVARYLVRRFGIVTTDNVLAERSAALAKGDELAAYQYLLKLREDEGLTDVRHAMLDLSSDFCQRDAKAILGLEEAAA